jgi:hypothetical protein
MPEQDRPIPTTCPVPNYDVIRIGGKLGQLELAEALKNIIDTLNAFIVRKGG